MKYYSEFSKQYVQDICNELNEAGAVMDKFSNNPFTPNNIDSITQLLQSYVVYSMTYFNILNQKGLVNRGRCPYTGEKTNNNSPSWSYMGTRKVYVSNSGLDIMKREADEDFEKLTGHPAPKIPIKTTSNSGGCYIATVCYGNENANEVIALKAYRDEVLSKIWYGRIFIKTYYFISPSIADFLKNKSGINRIIKERIINKIIKKIYW